MSASDDATSTSMSAAASLGQTLNSGGYRTPHFGHDFSRSCPETLVNPADPAPVSVTAGMLPRSARRASKPQHAPLVSGLAPRGSSQGTMLYLRRTSSMG